MHITITGAGAWGTAIAVHLSRHSGVSRVTLFTRSEKHALELRNEQMNNRYLPGVTLHKSIYISSSYNIQQPVLVEKPLLSIIATPLAGLAEALEASNAETPVLILCKGIAQDSLLLPHQIAAQFKPLRTAILSGPSFAQEVAAGLPCALSVAGEASAVNAAQQALHHGTMRLYTSSDCIGIELGGALKNVMAIAAGLCDGMQLGTNARAALITRGLAEMSRLGVALGARAETFMGLSGMGDLVLTCTGALSRNRRVGLELAAYKPLAEIIAQLGHVAEGVHTAQAALALAEKHGVDVPITQAVVSVLQGKLTPQSAITALLSRPAKNEFDN